MFARPIRASTDVGATSTSALRNTSSAFFVFPRAHSTAARFAYALDVARLEAHRLLHLRGGRVQLVHPGQGVREQQMGVHVADVGVEHALGDLPGLGELRGQQVAAAGFELHVGARGSRSAAVPNSRTASPSAPVFS